MHAEIDELRAELMWVYKTCIDKIVIIQLSHCLNIPKSNKFKGSRIINDIDNFIRRIKTYF